MEDGLYRFGDFSISPAERRLNNGSLTIPLPPKAFDTLLLFVRSHGTLVTRLAISNTLWPGTHVAEANLTNIVVLLRKTLGREAIQTVSKFGYRFTPAVTGEPGIRPAAYASFLRGKELLGTRTFETMRLARDHFLFCVAEDPQFASAWAWLGRTCRLIEKLTVEAPPVATAEAAFRRAFLLDPDLACAHQFYTQLQIDSGHSLDATIRLTGRIKTHGEEPETLAALVHTLRCCGLLQQSVAAHQRAVAIDPAARTSVAHTYFLLGNYPGLFETYAGPLYLDAAAWAALGQSERAIELLRPRVAWTHLGPLGLTLVASLLAVLEGNRSQALDRMENNIPVREPEGVFYLARHCALLNAAPQAVRLIRHARLGGFWSSCNLESDPAFNALRSHPEFIEEIDEAKRLESRTRHHLRELLGPLLPWLDPA